MDYADDAARIDMAMMTRWQNSRLTELKTHRTNDVVITNVRRCEVCGEIIPAERLEAIPDAKLCVYCQADLEKRKR